MRKAHAHMLDYQGPTQSAKIASDRRILRCMQIWAVATTKMAKTGAPVAAPSLSCTPSTPQDQPAPLATLSKLSCEYESVNVV